jgi:hypothetical protein
MFGKLMMAAAALSCMVSSAQAASIDWVTWLGASPTTAIGAIKLGDGSVVPGDGSVALSLSLGLPANDAFFFLDVPGLSDTQFGDGSVKVLDDAFAFNLGGANVAGSLM